MQYIYIDLHIKCGNEELWYYI